MRATVSEPIHLGPDPRLLSDRVVVIGAPVAALPGRGRATAREESAGPSVWSWSTLTDGVMLLGVVWSLPLAVLAVGTPIALAIVALLWLGRQALGAF
jgi:hypothetical protein